MLNVIRMELYRMFKTKSLYVIWIVMLLVMVATTVLMSSDLMNEDASPEIQKNAEQVQENNNIGMNVILPSAHENDVTVFGMIFANMQARAFALIVVIFAVIFSMADMNTGYIKNIGGQIRKKEYLIVAKVVALLVYTALSVVIFATGQALVNRIVFGYLKLGAAREFFIYLGLQTLLHFALAMIAMALAVLIRNNVFSMIIVICMCMNVLVILYSGIDKLVHKAGLENFQTLKYTVTGRISMLPMDMTGQQIAQTAVIAVVFTAVSVMLAGYVFRRRDI